MIRQKPGKQESARSPFAGCAILIAALGVMVFLIGFSVLTLFRQFNEIAKFTAEKPLTVEISSLADKQAEITQLTARIENFREQLTQEPASSLALSVEDLNLAIAHYEALKELRGTFRVLSIEGETLRVAISFPLNGKPRLTRSGETGWITSDSRFLNGTLVARPTLTKQEVVLSLDTIEVPGVKVAPEFIEQMSPYRFTERYLSDQIIGPAMARFTRVAVVGDQVVLSRNPGEIPVDTLTDAQVDAGSSRLFTTLGIAAVSFLAFAALIILIGMRARTRKDKAS
jgi:hypothetical protein